MRPFTHGFRPSPLSLAAFAIVCGGVLVLRYSQPGLARPFRVPFVWPVATAGAAACLYIMKGLPATAWERFGVWMIVGLALYAVYGSRHSRLRPAP